MVVNNTVNDLDQVALEWNVHKISRSRNSNCSTGRPVIMFEMPNIYHTQNYIINVPTFAIEPLASECLFNEYPCDEDFLPTM
ncbi:hypothetical protein NQ314_017710 [Rhamnusium bicolor]|uniref:Uncharacterized protein n=1 Tax=Rhamnusium bicolor TaxID=1586634 RepID=A0AAV8WSP9_9CUCU|nr:hypothetical protein NQ314_017710 [Rhamnusium bicolor]